MKKYFIGIWRHLKRNKVFALINAVGLTIGITCSLVMFVLVKFELGFDRHHQNYDRLYRVITEQENNGNIQHRVGVPKPLPEALKADISGVAEVAFFSQLSYGQFVIEDKGGNEKEFTEYRGLVHTEESFFKMFDWEWVEGSADGFDQPNTIILDETRAEKFFPGASAVGRTVTFNGKSDFTIIGVVKDRPDKSDFPFRIFVSLETLRASTDFTQWYSTSSNDRCYVMLNQGTNPDQVMAQFDGFVDKHLSDKSTVEFFLQPLADVHFDMLHSNLNYRSVPWGLIYTLSAVSILMILTACFNFINMSTAVALKRAREVGIRKVLGSSRRELIFSFLRETFGITFIALCISLALAERLLPGMVSEFADVDLELNLWTDGWLALYLGGLMVFVTLLAGLYPAWIISAFKPANLIRGGASGAGGRALNLRRVLIVFQFALSQVFIIGTLIVVWQMNYVKNADMGFRQDQMVTLNLPRGETNHADVWKSALGSNTGIVDFTFAQASPFSGMTSSTDVSYKDSVDHRFTVFLKPADSRYIDTYELELLAGEGLLESEERNRYVINEAFMRKMGLHNPSDAVGQMISVSGGELFPISGVVRDYHMRNFKSEVKPAVIFNNASQYWNLGLKLRAEDTEATLDAIEATWMDLYPDNDFSPVFMKEYISWYYERESRFFRMLVTFAIVAILISCLGLYGMISFMANQRAKEIGIRKVLGASVGRIVRLFSSEFARLAIIAFLLAAPLAYMGMQDWLNDFAYKISIGPAVFITGIGTSLLISLLTISYRSYRAGRANPVESLRDQ